MNLSDEASYEQQERFFGIDLRQVISAARRNIKAVVTIVLGGMILGVLMTFLMTPQYVASAQVLVEQVADKIIEGSDLQESKDQFDADRFLKTQVDILRSRSLAIRVVQRGRLADDVAFYVAMNSAIPQIDDLENVQNANQALTALRLETAVELVQSHLDIVLPVDSRIIKIRVLATNQVYAAKIANDYAESYIEANLKRKFESSAYARQFLASQLAESRSKVEASERELNQFSREAGLIRISGQGQNADRETTLSVTNDALVQLNSAASTASADRVAAEQRWKTIANEHVLEIPQVINNMAIQDILKQKAIIEAQLADERTRHLGDYPTVKNLTAQVSELDQRINAIGNSIKRSVFLEYKSAKAREASITSRVNSLRQNAMAEQDRGVGYAVLKRVAETDRSLYDTLLERYNQLNASAGSTTNNITLVDSAEVPREPDSPNLVLNLLTSLILSIAISVVYVVLREHFDDTIRTPIDVENKLGVPLLGLIPLANELELVDVKSSVNEAYHSLVTNLRYSTGSGLPRTLLVTSTNESEGKTTTVHAIAVDLAKLGKSVLLMDADLRRPTLHRRLDDTTRLGLTELLVGDATLDEVLNPSKFTGLTYMTALPVPPDPSVLLGGERLPQILRDASERFDIVIIDSAPLLGLADTATIASLTDGVLFVIDALRYRRAATRAALQRLSLVNATVLGAVVTKFDAQSANGDYSYYGYSYYTYGSDLGGKDS